MTWYQEWFGEEYLDLYSYRDEEEARLHASFFRSKFGSIEGPLLDLACGTGRHVQELAGEGYSVIGCDLSYVLLRTGLRQYGPMLLARADMRSLPFQDGHLAGLVNFFTSFGYFATDGENARVVSEMARVLRPTAPFLFDYLNLHRELARLIEREERATESGKVLIERWFDASDRSFNKRITIGGRRFLERVRGYDLDEISLLFTAAGLALRDVFGDFDGSPFDRESPRMIVIGRRN